MCKALLACVAAVPILLVVMTLWAGMAAMVLGVTAMAAVLGFGMTWVGVVSGYAKQARR